MSVLNNGDKGAGVILLQGILHRLGYEITNVDGHFGPETKNAIEAFQTNNGLDVDGKVGNETANALVGEVWSLGMEVEDYSDDGDMSMV